MALLTLSCPGSRGNASQVLRGHSGTLGQASVDRMTVGVWRRSRQFAFSAVSSWEGRVALRRASSARETIPVEVRAHEGPHMNGLDAARLGFALLLLVLGLQAVGGRALADRPLAHRWAPYDWPVKPFDKQHPVQATFGDPRTMDPTQPFGRTGPGLAGAYSFHNGIDITAYPGTPVYPVVSGRVIVALAEGIVVRTGDGRSFQYDHLDLAVHRGQIVVAERTVLGWVNAKHGHVHLAEIDHGLWRARAHNPLDYGHLQPYSDRTTPVATGLYLDGSVPRPVGAQPVGPHAQLVVAAADEPPQRALVPYTGFRPTPALVEWRLLQGTEQTPWQVIADFRHTEPPPRDFWNVYAPGTYQNDPVFDYRHYIGSPGRYLYHVRLDRSRLRPGLYRLDVRVADIRGNSSTTSWRLRLAEH
jgi:hypothetical protein